MLAISLALRDAFPIQAAADAQHDDALFVRLASSLRAGDWLGPYDNLTHAKGAAYSMFIALNSFTGLPLKMAEHAVYLAACAAFSLVAAWILRSRAAGLVCLVLLAFNPVCWSADSGGRVVREGLYASLSLALVALAAAIFIVPRARPLGEELRRRSWLLLGLGALGGVFWLTREEGAWIAPALLAIAAIWLWRERRPQGEGAWRHARVLAGFLAFPLGAFAVVVGGVNAANYAAYGEFRNNDFRSNDFVRAYGALGRIRHDAWMPFVAFPADARRRAYAVSPAARELAPFFEGEGGENWRRTGCTQTETSPCPEILSGWLMWALRDAVAQAGHYSSAGAARGFYRRLAREVHAACDRGEIACGSRRDTMMPPWRPEYAGAVFAATVRVFKAVARLGDVRVHVRPSRGTPEQLAAFARMTHDPQARLEDWMKVLPGRMTWAQAIARVQVALTTYALPGALVLWPVLLVTSLRRRRWHPGHALVAALAAAVAARVALLGYIEATSIPANDVLYLTPAAPFALALAPCIVFLALDMFRHDDGPR